MAEYVKTGALSSWGQRIESAGFRSSCCFMKTRELGLKVPRSECPHACKISHKDHKNSIQVYSVNVMPHVITLEAGQSSQGTFEADIPGGIWAVYGPDWEVYGAVYGPGMCMGLSMVLGGVCGCLWSWGCTCICGCLWSWGCM